MAAEIGMRNKCLEETLQKNLNWQIPDIYIYIRYNYAGQRKVLSLSARFRKTNVRFTGIVNKPDHSCSGFDISTHPKEERVKKSSLFYLMSLVVIFSMLLAACQPAAATATTAPTQAAAAPTATTAAAQPTTAAAQPTATTAAAQPTATTAAAQPTATTAAASGSFTPLTKSATDCTYGGEFKSIEAVDQYTVKFTLCTPDPAFASKVAFNVFSIAEKKVLDADGGDSVKMSDNAIGTGPWVLKSWQRGDSITFTSNPNYWGTKPAVGTFIMKWSDQAAQRLLELQSGQADGIDNVDPNDFDTVKNDAILQLIPREALNVFYIGMNNTFKPFDNEQVRQAFAQAIDRKRIVDQYYPKGSLVAENFTPPSMKPGHSDNVTWYDYNPDAAKKLLTDAKFDFNQEIQLVYRNVARGYLPAPDKVAQEIQAQLKLVGVKVKVVQQESTTFLDNTSAGKVAFFMLGWGADYPDATDFYDYHLSTPAVKLFGNEYQDIVDPIKKADVLTDATARQAQYDIVNQKIKEHVPFIPVAHGGSAVAFTKTVQNAMTGPLANEPFYMMNNGKDTMVFVQNGEPAALWCSDETDGESIRACQQIYEPLLNYKPGGVEVVPWLAEKWTPNADLTEWTFNLKHGVKFSDGNELTANDVVATYVSMWDTKDPNHKGRTGSFEYYNTFFGTFLNAPKK
jgi:ABC-type transport system substrate-binding protein